METLDRKLVYIEIIRMRPLARQAKVSVLRKHVRKIKQLHGRQKKNPKNEQKIERLSAEVQDIKKILVDAISKYAMITPVKTCEKRMADVDASLTIRVLSRLSSENVIVQKMVDLEKKYKNWADVSLILKGARKTRARTKSKKHGNVDMDSQDIDDAEAENNSDVMSDNEEDGAEFHESENSQTEEEDELHSLSPPSSKVNRKQKQASLKPKEEKILVKKEKPTTAVVRKLTNLEELETLVSDSEKVNATEVGTVRKDSFFLSSQGEEVESEDESESSESEQSDEGQGEAKFNRVYHNRNKSDPGAKPSSQKHIASLNSNKRSQVDPKSDEKLHPSWEAKRKLKEAIQIGKPQQNKKIIFDE
ncbi:hypothetical protein B566_EDAN010212 [Ephemera danica]|nr:hypothetical protein B566_EDAN010212 [Ephemera danica]